MVAPSRVSKAKAILLAVNYAAESDFKALQQLSSSVPNELPLEIILRILLTYVPETVEPTQYVPLLLHLASERPQTDEDEDLDLSSVEGLSEDEARQKVRRLRLLPLRGSNSTFEATDSMSTFLVHRAHRIDTETGLLNLTPALIVPFLDRSQQLRTWFISTLLPLLRLHYEYYPHSGLDTSLATFEKLSDGAALGLLLSQAGAKGDSLVDITNRLARDLKGLAGPWAYGRGSSTEPTSGKGLASIETPLGLANDPRTKSASPWLLVYEWLVWTATKDLGLVIEAVHGWGGPRDVDLGGYADTIPGQDEEALQALDSAYAQAAIAVFYAAPSAMQHPFSGHQRLLARICSLTHLDPSELNIDLHTLPDIATDFTPLVNASRTFLLPDTAMRPENTLTVPSEASLFFLRAILLSSGLLAPSGFDNSPRSLADLCLFAAEDVQRDALQRCIRGLAGRSDTDDRRWVMARREFLWLWRWREESRQSVEGHQEPPKVCGVFRRVQRSFLETELLKAFLLGLHYQAVIETYLRSSATSAPLPLDQVEQAIWEVAMSFYDNATNGNRSRGAMRKASDIIGAFYPEFFPQSAILGRAEKLITATHHLSFYSLVLQPRVPFRPVTLRVHPDPIALFGKVLEQNRRSYTRVGALIAIGRNLVEAGLVTSNTDDVHDGPAPSDDDVMRNVQRRIASMAIEAALVEDDLETAHRLVLEELPVDTAPARSEGSAANAPDLARPSRIDDDISWRTAFHAGCYRPTTPLARSTTSRAMTPTATSIRHLEMRLELLSRALLLAPAAALTGILSAWQQCDEELQAAMARVAEYEEEWDDRVHGQMAGRFVESTSGSSSGLRLTTGGDDEGPMGLFDVARGAAAALSKTAFPLRASVGSGRGPALGVSQDDIRSTHSHESHEMGEEGRVRKRDQLSNMVTGGLASGLGWVLGATPVPTNTGHDS